MSRKAGKLRSLIALSLIFSLLQVWAVASPAVMSVKNDKANGKADVLYGTLATIGDRAVNINGSNVRSGTTVMSGALIETPETVGASLQMSPLGRLEIAPQTRLQLSFIAGHVDVNLISGCAILTTYEGVEGTVSTPQGTTERIGPAKRSFIDVCTGEDGAAAPIVGEGAAAKAGAGVCWGVMRSDEVDAAYVTASNAKGFNPFLLFFGAAPLAFGVLFIANRNGRPPVASASGL